MLRMLVLQPVHEAITVEQILFALILWVLPGFHGLENGDPLPFQSLCLQTRAEWANPEDSEAEAQCGFHKHYFCFLKYQISLMHTCLHQTDHLND